MAHALAYIRYSSDPQSSGDSLRRQRDLAKVTARLRGLTITEWIEDLGVSAYRGEHVETGSLGKLLDRIRRGKIERGTHLLFESFDRLSRLHVFDSTRVILDLYEAGLILITTADNTVHERDQGLLGLLRPMLEGERAHGESARKADLGQKTWAAKRIKAAKGEAKITAICPAWLMPVRNKEGLIIEFKPRQQRDEIVRRIFREAANGIGKYSIAARLNADHIPAWRGKNGWHGSYVHKIMTNRAVIGECQPHRKIERAFEARMGRRVGGKRVPEGEAIAGYYPAIINMALWERTRAARADRKGRGGRKGMRLANLLSGLCKCGDCNSTMTYRSPGAAHGRDYLVCDSALRRTGCLSGRRHPYLPLEQAVLAHLDDLLFDPAGLDSNQLIAAENDVAILADARKAKELEIKRLIDGIASGNPYVTAAINERTDQIDSIKAKEAAAKEKLEEVRGRLSSSERQAAIKALDDDLKSYDESIRYAARSRLAQEIRSVVTKVVFEPYEDGSIIVVVGHGVRYYDLYNGCLRALSTEDWMVEVTQLSGGDADKEAEIIRTLERITRMKDVQPDQLVLHYLRHAFQTAQVKGSQVKMRFPSKVFNLLAKRFPALANANILPPEVSS